MKSLNNIKLPNFLIVGAAKSGTTALYHYLSQHPEIYMSPLKEPKFITSNFLKFPFQGPGDNEVEKMIVKSFDRYCDLFKGVKNEKAIGEASADNLYYYEQAIFYIKKYIGNPKIIIILRNPIERAYSAYLHLVRDERETLSFKEALAEEEKRRKQNWEFIWFYKNVGFYFNQVKAYLENFTQVKVYFYEELRDSPVSLLKSIFRFLEVDDSFVPNIEVKYNVSFIPRIKSLHNFLVKPNVLKSLLKSFVSIFKSDELISKIINYLVQKNLYRPEIDPKIKEYLKNLYQNDILQLQNLLKKDLSHWIR